MNKHILQRLAALQKILMAHYEGGSNLPNAVKGDEREVFIREFLSKMFPNQFRFTSGAITDPSNSICELSGQNDIILELPFSPSFPLLVEDQRLVLTDSVAAIIEVKSNLSKQWDQVLKTLNKVRLLTRKIDWIQASESGIHDFLGIKYKDIDEKIPFFVVSYKGYKKLSSLENRLKKIPNNIKPDGVLIIESGVFVYKDIKETDEKGLYAFISVLTALFCILVSVNPGLEKYI
jgi:hypothetical protein